ncbi:MAG: protein kinase [Planctomycetes bacterium]|nr:protein kinase [Planctomycetota bacterium]
MPQDDVISREDQVNLAIAEYLLAVERGQAPARDHFLAEHADIADDLRDFMTAHGQLQALVHDLDPPGQSVDRSAVARMNPESNTPVEANAVSRASVPPTTIMGAHFTESDATSMPSPDDLLIEEEIARGGMGVVFKGRDARLGRDVAVKVLLEKHQDDPDLLNRFFQEAQISGQLQHPGVTPVYAMGRLPDQRPFFTMKLVQGETLSRLLKARPDPEHDRQKFLKIFEQVCQTVAYAHSRGVIHRDLKPANIMVGAFGEVQVMDWGLGKVLNSVDATGAPAAEKTSAPPAVVCSNCRSVSGDSTDSGAPTQPGSVLGTLAYISPEQALGQTSLLDQKSDVFGLGAILCEILTGTPPYLGTDSVQLRNQAARGELSEAFDRLERCGADFPLIVLARRALAPLPADRPADAREMAHEVAAYLEGVELRLREAELAEVAAVTRVAAERTRRKHVIALSVVVLSVLACGVLGTGWGLIRAERAYRAELVATETVRRELYVADLELAGQVWDSGTGTAQYVNDLLSRHTPRDGQPDLREFAWRFQWTALRNQYCRLMEHDRGARLVAFAPDGQIVTLDGGLALKHWDLPSGRNSRATDLRDAPHIWCHAISNDARWIALGGDATVHLFQCQDGRRTFSVPGRALVLALSFSAEGDKLAVVWGDGVVQIWGTGTGELLRSWTLTKLQEISSLESVAVAPDGQSVFLVGYPTSRQLTWAKADRSESLLETRHESRVYSVALSRDGTFGASGDANGLVCLWNVVSADSPVGTFRAHRGKVTALQLSADAKLLAVGTAEGVVTVWDVASRRVTETLKGHLDRIHDLSFLADGTLLASASQDGDVRVWKLGGSGASRMIGSADTHAFSVAWSKDGRYLAVGTGDEAAAEHDEAMQEAKVKVWDPAARTLVRELRAGTGRVLAVAISPDGRLLATGGWDSTLRVWNLESGELQYQQPGPAAHADAPLRRALGTLAISPDGTLIVAGFGRPSHHLHDYDQVAIVWNLATGEKLRELSGHSNTICSVVFSPDGKWLATASDDRQVKLWSVQNWEERGHIESAERFKSVAFSPQGNWIATGSQSGTITIWDTVKLQVLRQLTGHTSGVPGLAFSPDGRTLASAGWDSTVKLWDPISGRETRTFRDFDDWVTGLAFAPGGNSLATVSFDKTVRLWDAASWQTIEIADAHERGAASRLEERQRQRQMQRSVEGTFPATVTLLERYVGTYENGLKILRSGDHLTVYPLKGARGAAAAVYAQSETRFTCREHEIDVTFLTDEQGQVTRVLVYQDGEAFEALKVHD